MKQKIPFSQFVKPYSRGQITIPQEFRDYLGIDSNVWLFLAIRNDSLVIKPVKEEEIIARNSRVKSRIRKASIPLKEYVKLVPKFKGAFGSEIEKDYQEVRKGVEERLKNLEL